MQLENLTKEQFIRDFKDTLHQEQLIKVAKATPTEIFTALAGLIRKYYTNTWIERNHALSDNQEKIAYYFSIEFLPGRMLETNLLNLGILDLVKEGFAELDIDFREVVEAAAIGCNWSFAPIVDINRNWRNPIISTRTWSADVEQTLESLSALDISFPPFVNENLFKVTSLLDG